MPTAFDDGRPVAMARRKLVLVTPWTTARGGGVAEAARLTARLLAAEPGIAVRVLSVRDPDDHRDLDDWGGVPIESFRAFGPDSYRLSPGLLAGVLRSDAALMHVHGLWSFQCLAVLLWSIMRRRPYVVSPHGMLEAWILRRSRALKALVDRLYQRRFLRRAAAIQVLTGAEAAQVAPYAGHGRVAVIPNCVEPPAGPPGMPDWLDASMRQRRIYLFFGRIHGKKQWRALCAAWERACGSGSFRDASQLVFCGRVDGAPDFEAVVAGLAARHGNVRFAGPQAGAARMASLAAADALVLPSLSEGQPMAVLEAWAAGTPVLMTAACNLPEGFARKAALEIGAGPDAIAAGLLQFAALSAAERLAMGQAGRELAATTFSPDLARRRLLELYASVIRQHAAGRAA